ncbi:MAG: hypothetical protein MZV64_46740 [Ignavibacteriales bacterium]|nr:hypothetical protein [Ignavibacteriales bacterium]
MKNGIVEYSTEGDSDIYLKVGETYHKLVVDAKNRLKETDKANNVIEGVFVVKNKVHFTFALYKLSIKSA